MLINVAGRRMLGAMNDVVRGLEGVVVAETRLGDVDGEHGRLWIAGRPLEEVADLGFEGTCALLWRRPRDEVRGTLAAARRAAFARLPDRCASGAMVALREGLAAYEDADDAALVGAVPVLAAAWARRRAGLEPLAPDASRDHAADFLAMVQGGEPAAARARALDRYLATVSEHGMNASTFAVRVVASTAASRAAAIVAGVCALEGPLHGGAPGPVLDMLDAIGVPEQAEAWLRGELAAGRRIMGMGHRIYRTRDPRAAVFERAVRDLGAGGRIGLARAVEREAERLLAERHPGRALRANVEFYTAVLLEAVGIPRALFTATFAAGRVAGWCAHYGEEREGGRLMRPSSRYVGPRP
jgi:citrate synthase